MALGETGISITAVRNESQQGSKNYVSGLNTSSLVNPYSFWSPRGTIFDSTNGYLLTNVTDPAPFNIGDFRRYYHAAAAPNIELPSTSYTASAGQTAIGVVVFYNNNEFNFRRADPTGQIARIGMTFFNSLSDAQNFPTTGTGRLEMFDGNGNTINENVPPYRPRYGHFQDIRYPSSSPAPAIRGYQIDPPLTGHSVTQTQCPDSIQRLNVPTWYLTTGGTTTAFSNQTSFRVSDLSTGFQTKYVRVDFYSATDTTHTGIRGKLANNIFSFTINKQSDPAVMVIPYSVDPLPSGWTTVFVSSNYTYNNQTAYELFYGGNTTGSSTISFKIKVRGISGITNDYVYGRLSLQYYDKLNNGGTWVPVTGYQDVEFQKATWGPNATAILQDGSYSLTVTHNLPSGNTWASGVTHEYRVSFCAVSFTIPQTTPCSPTTTTTTTTTTIVRYSYQMYGCSSGSEITVVLANGLNVGSTYSLSDPSGTLEVACYTAVAYNGTTTEPVTLGWEGTIYPIGGDCTSSDCIQA